MSDFIKKYITIDDSILGGTPVISGTRIPVDRIKFLFSTGYTTQMIKLEYPQVSVKKIQMLMIGLMQIGLDEVTKYQKTHSA